MPHKYHHRTGALDWIMTHHVPWHLSVVPHCTEGHLLILPCSSWALMIYWKATIRSFWKQLAAVFVMSPIDALNRYVVPNWLWQEIYSLTKYKFHPIQLSFYNWWCALGVVISNILIQTRALLFGWCPTFIWASPCVILHNFSAN